MSLSHPTHIGIVGGGQLGRMLALAAAPLGIKVYIYAPEETPPAADVAFCHIRGAYEDKGLLDEFAESVEVITYEFENIPLETVTYLAEKCPVFPDAIALDVAQDRLHEKNCFAGLNIPLAPFQAVDSIADMEEAVEKIGLPLVLKTRRFGYDGKGQVIVRDAASQVEEIRTLLAQPCVAEAFIPFDYECSVIAARNKAGETEFFDMGRNEHKNHILHRVHVPSDIPHNMKSKARDYTEKLLHHLEYVGVLALEFFVAGEELLANECAPRVHNSGHWSMDGCLVSQFEQHIRAISGLPLIPPARIADVMMENLIGEDINHISQYLSNPQARLHLYGKTQARQGRKMGHINFIRK